MIQLIKNGLEDVGADWFCEPGTITTHVHDANDASIARHRRNYI